MMIARLLQKPSTVYALFAVLLLPALLINLGAHHIFVHTDEARRALVALEMELTGQYIAPTLFGEWYYNKPPAYNWLIVLFFKLFGNYSEFALRFPVVVSILAFGASIYYYVRRALGVEAAWMVVIATITSGRILFYDSFLGLIDIAFSALVFVNFMLFYTLGAKGPGIRLFATSYALMALAFLMKGLPPVVFQACTLVAWLVYHRRWKWALHYSHFAGVLFFVVPLTLYYVAYLSVNEQELSTLFGTLFSESSKRTVTEHGVGDTLLKLLLFPVENMYHFAPWTVLVAVLFAPGVLPRLWEHPFTRFCILTFGFNIWVYWTSPGVHPRYLFMFLPLFFAVLWQGLTLVNPGFKLGLEKFILIIMWLVVPAPLVWLYFAPQQVSVFDGAVLLTVFVSLGAVAWWAVRVASLRWPLLGVFLVLLRIGFDVSLLPIRDARGRAFADAAEEVNRITGTEPLYVLAPNWCHDGIGFIVARHRREVLRVVDSPTNTQAWYIVYDGDFNEQVFEPHLQFQTRGSDRTLYLVRLRAAGQAHGTSD